MPTRADYQFTADGAWRLVVWPNAWSSDLQNKIVALVNEQPSSKHPQTIEVDWPPGGGGRYYLKIFHGIKRAELIKDLFRASKAFRFWGEGVALSEAGFNVPLTIAAGEERCWRFVKHAFVLTEGMEGQPLPKYLAELAKLQNKRRLVKAKREGLLELAQVIREFHRRGFVHGDLVASNLFISSGAKGELIYIMDNDRTRRYPRWLPQTLWKRNLIQLNRMPLPGVTLQDRMRFFRVYLSTQRFTSAQRRFARWLERKTRLRRKECDGADVSVDFRRLMRWSPDFRKPADPKRVA